MKVYSNSNMYPPSYNGPEAKVSNCLICNGCSVLGTVEHSILSFGVQVEEGAKVIDSILLPGAVVKKGARVERAIIGENTVIEEGAVFGDASGEEIAVIGDNDVVEK